MMKHEFEALAGYEVSTADYDKIIEPMYMATDLSKEDFIKVIDKKRFALKPISNIVKEMKECAKSLKESCTHYTDYVTKAKLNSLAREYTSRKYGMIATFGTSEEMLWTCYYPTSIEIFDTKTYKTIETIDLGTRA